MRLDKFICKSTELTRNEAKKLLKQGKVLVNNKPADNGAMQVHENNQVSLEGKILTPRQSRYIMLHKPANYICSNVDENFPSLLHLINVEKAFDLHIAGRLDADTTGLVLITDDGRWSHNIISPKKSCAKIYRVTLRDPLKSDIIEKFKQGVQLQGEKNLTLPAILQKVTDNQVLLTLTEGKYHQVKRMFAAVGNRVVNLHRQQIGAIKLDQSIPVGQWRYLSPKEFQAFI